MKCKNGCFKASEALAYGRGGIAEVIRISGVSRNTIKRGIDELKSGVVYDGEVRKSGGGRNCVENKYPGIEEEIRKLIDGSTYGSPYANCHTQRKVCGKLNAN
jgi:hypothetical protein